MSYRRYSNKRASDNLLFTIVIAAIGLLFIQKLITTTTGMTITNQFNLNHLVIFLIVLGIVLIVLGRIIQIVKYQRLSKTGIFDIDKMSGEEFEERLEVLFKNLGYSVRRTGRTSDAGVDLIIEKDNRKIAVQAKRYTGNVGEAAVQQVHTGKVFYRCDEAIVVTNSEFTSMAWKVAFGTGVKLWSRNYLIKVLETEHKKLSISK